MKHINKALIFTAMLVFCIGTIVSAKTTGTDKVNENTVNNSAKNSKVNAKQKKKINVKAPKLELDYVGGRAALTWKKSKKGDMVEIWYSENKKSGYKKKAVTGQQKHLIGRFEHGRLYYVKLREYRKVGKKTYRSRYSNVVTVVSNVSIKKVKSPQVGTISVSWEKAVTADGYNIQANTDRTFKNAGMLTIGKSKTSVKLYDREPGKVYYVRIRTYKNLGNGTRHGLWSEPVKVKVTSAASVVNGDYKDTKGFFKDSVFFGDSVLAGFGIYVNNKGGDYLDGARVMGVVSYSLTSALKENSEYHPLYRGKHTPPQDVVKALGAKKVFLFFGINDILGTGDPQLCLEKYKQLINNIKKVNPGVEVYIISTTYSNKGSRDYVNYTNNLHRFNELLRDYCKNGKCNFVDVASYLSTTDGYLNPNLCSDGFVHQTMEAYSIWDKALRYYAWNRK